MLKALSSTISLMLHMNNPNEIIKKIIISLFSEELTIIHSKTMVKPPSFTFCPWRVPRSSDTSEARQSSERERSGSGAAAACQSRARANAQLGNTLW